MILLKNTVNPDVKGTGIYQITVFIIKGYFQLYHGENKLHFNDMMMFTLYSTNFKGLFTFSLCWLTEINVHM
jgi:hypothetical protein